MILSERDLKYFRSIHSFISFESSELLQIVKSHDNLKQSVG